MCRNLSYLSILRDTSRWMVLLTTLLVIQLVCTRVGADEPDTPTGDALDQALDEPDKQASPAGDDSPGGVPFADSEAKQPPPFMPPPKQAKPLTKEGRAWIDRQQGTVIVDGRIVLRRGLLEMFACPPNTKEHESIVAVQCKAFIIHAGLLAVGAETGTPVQFGETVIPPTGTQIDIFVQWKDEKGKPHRVKAQSLMRDANTKKEMSLPWVFAGSMFVQNERNGTSHYLAEDGDLVCVANFGSAMLDVPAEASSSNGSLLFECFTERIPPLGWPVRLIFDPVLEDEQQTEKQKPDDKKPAANPPTGSPQKNAATPIDRKKEPE